MLTKSKSAIEREADQNSNIFIVTNSLDYFCAHKEHLFSGIGTGQNLTLFAAAVEMTERKPKDIDVVPIPLDPVRHIAPGDFAALWTLITSIIKQKPAMVVSFSIKANLLSAAAILAARIFSGANPELIVVNSGLGRVFRFDESNMFARWRYKVAKSVSKYLYKYSKTNAIFENSADRANWIDTGIISSQRAHVISGTGIDLPPSIDFDQKPDKAPLKVVFAGRMIREKGIGTLLAAAEKLDGKTDVFFDVFGDADPSEKNRVALEDIKLPSNVRFHGAVEFEQLADFLKAAHCVCLPTVYGEGLPRILLEGAAYGCCLIATDAPGCNDLIEDGETGFLLPVMHQDALAQRLTEVLAQLAENPKHAKSMGRTGRSQLEGSKFTTQSVRSQFQKILSNLYA